MFFSLRKEKNEKKPQASGLTVRAAGSGSMAAMKDGVHARGARVIRQPPPFLLISYRSALTRRAPCACVRRLPSGTYFPHGEWWPVRASRALQHLSSRGYVLPGRKLRVRDGVSVNLLVLFSLRRKVHILSFGKERNMFFSLRKEKNEKKPQASGLTVRAAGSGSMAAMKDGVHARGARVIRQPPPFLLISYRSALTRRAPCTCGRRLPSGTNLPHGEWWPVRAPRALQHLRAVGMCFSVEA